MKKGSQGQANQMGGTGGMGGGQAPQAAPLTWRQKAGYIGTGIVIGVVIYPFVRKTVAKVQPNLDKLFDALTGKAEGFAEMASDLIAKAKDNLREEAAKAAKPGTEKDVKFTKAEAHEHGPGCNHDH